MREDMPGAALLFDDGTGRAAGVLKTAATLTASPLTTSLLLEWETKCEIIQSKETTKKKQLKKLNVFNNIWKHFNNAVKVWRCWGDKIIELRPLWWPGQNDEKIKIVQILIRKFRRQKKLLT